MNLVNYEKVKKFDIAVVTSLIGGEGAGELFVTNFMQMLEPICEGVFLITGNFSDRLSKKIHVINVESGKSYDKKRSLCLRIPRVILTQLRLSLALIKVSSRVDIVAFYVGGPMNVLPMLCARLLGKRTILFYFGSRITYEKDMKEMLFGLGGTVFPRLLWILQTINLLLADQVAVESKSVTEFAGLSRYKKKIVINGARYVDIRLFTIKKNLEDRKNLVGYIGGLRPVKGISNFAKAVPIILREGRGIDFLIGGNGPLFNRIDEELRSSNSLDRTNLAGPIPHQEIPDYLNELKLLVLPSYSEGIPGIVQEAMACGTPVLATPVGGVPDLIKDSETGFIMEDNSPECIARNVIRALDHPNLEQITRNARALIEKEYTYEKVVERYREILAGSE